MWGKVEIPDGVAALYTAGTCRMFVQRCGDEWLISNEYQGDRGQTGDGEWQIGIDALPEELSWKRYVTGTDTPLELLPALPDRPLVIRPEAPISVLPRRNGRFYVSIPIWLSLRAGQPNKQMVVTEIPSVVLSNTWFGDPAAGELCYSLDAPLLRAPEALVGIADRAICTFVVTNGSTERLDFQRICVHVENLSLFTEADILWTNELNVVFKGSDQISQISIKPQPPAQLREPQPIAKPRTRPNNNILKRSFSAIRHITGF